MHPDQFESMMKRISEHYEQSIPQKRQEFIWKHVKYATNQQFWRVCNEIMEEFDNIPPLKVWKNKTSIFKRKYFAERKQEDLKEFYQSIRDGEREHCKWCDDRGICIGYPKEDPWNEVHFRCTACEAHNAAGISEATYEPMSRQIYDAHIIIPFGWPEHRHAKDRLRKFRGLPPIPDDPQWEAIHQAVGKVSPSEIMQMIARKMTVDGAINGMG
jgi:hypothetical protein